MKHGPPPVKSQVAEITSMCETIPMIIKQTVEDNSEALAQLKLAGQVHPRHQSDRSRAHGFPRHTRLVRHPSLLL